MLLFIKFCSFRAKTRRMSLVFEIGHEETKLTTFRGKWANCTYLKKIYCQGMIFQV